ncbi:LysR substrate-binding domain-containing protein [Paraburkholderia adhaesiva]|uniref:LysR substrate-binding domain-containing protein n=1 Tax=Paraburkholderia adhaesiva TaxID=2883244 RepID=UPI003571603D
MAISQRSERARHSRTKQRPIARRSSLARREAALEDWGVASPPEFAVGDDLRAGRLVQVLPEWAFEPRAYSGPVWLLYPPNRLLPPKMRALIDWLVEQSGG